MTTKYLLQEDKKQERKNENSESRYLLVFRMRILNFGKNFAGEGKISASIGN